MFQENILNIYLIYLAVNIIIQKKMLAYRVNIWENIIYFNETTFTLIMPLYYELVCGKDLNDFIFKHWS